MGNCPRSTGSTISITVGYWAAFVIAIPYLTADRSQQKSLNRAGTKLTENFGLMLTIYNLHGKDVPLKSWIYKFENWL